MVAVAVNYSAAAVAEQAGGAGGAEHELPLLLLYSLVVLTGIAGNLSLMAVIAVGGGSSRLRTPQLLSVCAADLLVCGASAPLAACRARAPRLPCHLAAYLEAFPVSASTLSLLLLALDRYATVRRGRLLSSLCARPLLAVGAAWLAAALVSLSASHAPCAHSPALAALYALLAYCAPTAGVAACHLAVRARLTALSLTARAAHGELPLPVPLLRRPTHVIIVAGVGGPERRMRRDAVDIGGGRKRSPQPSLLGPQPVTSTLHSRRRLANVLVGVAALFAACWCPHALVSLALAGGAHMPAALPRYTLLLGHAHSALNAAAYWALNRHALAAACAAWRLPTLAALRPREERPSSTNEAALGAFHPRLARPAPAPRPPPSSFLY